MRTISDQDDLDSGADITGLCLPSNNEPRSLGPIEGKLGFGYDKAGEATSKTIRIHDLTLMFSPSNPELRVHDGDSGNVIVESSESSDIFIHDASPFSDNTALSTFTPDPTSEDMAFCFSTDSFQSPFDEIPPFDAYSINSDFSLSPPFALSIQSFESSGALFDSPYLKLRYLTSLHHSVSRSSAVTRRKTPFIESSRNAGCQLGQSFLLQNIRCFPKMMLDPNNPPPFIHPCALTHSASENNLQPVNHEFAEPLAACQSIMQINSMNNNQMSAFLWRTVTSEQKRLNEQVRTIFLLPRSPRSIIALTFSSIKKQMNGTLSPCSKHRQSIFSFVYSLKTPSPSISTMI